MSIYTVYAANLGGTLISGCTEEQEFDSGIEETMIRGDGSPTVDEVVPERLSPEIRFGSTEIDALLDKISYAGWAIDPSAILFCQKMTSTGRSTGSDHIRMTVNQGVVVPDALAASQGAGGHAVMRGRIIPSWDGTNELIVPAAASLSGSPSVGKVFTVGPCKLNDAWITQIQAINVAFNVGIDRHWSDGEGRPRELTLATLSPVISITTTNVSILTSLGLVGTYGGANTVVYFTRCKGSDTSMRYGDNDSEHVSIAALGRVTVRRIGGTPQAAEIILQAKKVGSDPILDITTGTTIA